MDALTLNAADWVLVAWVTLSVLIGAWRGLVSETLSLAIWLIAFIVANAFAGALSAALAERVASESLRFPLAFGGLFLLTLVIGGLVSRALGGVVSASGLSGVDRVLGMGFGAARAVVIAVVGAAMLEPLVGDTRWWQSSALIPHLIAAEDAVFDMFADLAELIGRATQPER